MRADVFPDLLGVPGYRHHRDLEAGHGFCVGWQEALKGVQAHVDVTGHALGDPNLVALLGADDEASDCLELRAARFALQALGHLVGAGEDQIGDIGDAEPADAGLHWMRTPFSQNSVRTLSR